MAPPERRSFRLKIKLKPQAADKFATEVETPNEPEVETPNEPEVETPNEPEVTPGKKTNMWRQNLKKNRPKEYKVYAKQDAISHQIARIDMTAQQRADSNEQSKNGMRRLRARRKAEKEAEELAQREHAGPPEKKRETRAMETEEQKLRDKRAAEQRRTRAKWTPEHRATVNERRREKRRQEKLDALAYRRHLLEQKKMQEEMKRNEEEELNKILQEEEQLDKELSEYAEAGPSGRTSSAKRKSLSRALANISTNPIVYADTVIDLIDKASPRKKKALKRKRITPTKETIIAHVISQGVKKKLLKLKKKQTYKARMQRRELANTLSYLKKYKLQKAGCKSFGVSPKVVSSEPQPLLFKNPKAIPENVKKLVQSYYITHSSPAPDKRRVSAKTGQASRILERPIQVLYNKYKKEFPETAIGISSFFKLRPKNVKTMSSLKYRGCLCEICENVRLKLKVITSCSVHQEKPKSRIKDLDEACNITLCSNGDHKYRKLACIERRCKECGPVSIHNVLSALDKTQDVSWYKWETINVEKVNKKGVQQKITKKAKITKSGSLKEMIDELVEEIGPLSLHLFNKNWQNEQFSSLTSKRLPEGWCTMVMDFAENYACTSQDEVSAAHWTHDQVTVHPIVAYYNCHHVTCIKPIMHSMVFISDDLNHDYNAVNEFSMEAIQHITQGLGIMISKVIRWSDGCAAQYKSKGPFLDISYSMVDNGVPIQHEFFGSRHGKGPSDGESAVVKKSTSMAVLGGAVLVSNAEEMYNYCADNLTRKGCTEPDQCSHFQRSIFWVPSSSINRDRKRESKTLAGTRMVQSLKTVKPGMVSVRNLTCYCSACVEGCGSCTNRAYVKVWSESSVGSPPNEDHSGHLEGSSKDDASRNGRPTKSSTSDTNQNGSGPKLPPPSDANSPPSAAADCQVDNTIDHDPTMNGSSTISLPSDTSINESPTKLLPPSDADSPAKLPSSAADCQVDNPKDHGANVNGSPVKSSPSDIGVNESPPKLTTTSEADHYYQVGNTKVGDYVAVIYDDTWWPGEVKQITGETYRINFMKQKGVNRFVWPERDDTADVHRTGIFTRLPSHPNPINNRHLGFDSQVATSVTTRVNAYLQENKH